MIKNLDSGSLWYKLDTKFKKPKGYVALEIATNDLGFGQTPGAATFAEVWLSCLLEFTDELCYMAKCADLTFRVTTDNDTLSFKWGGFSSSLPLFISEFTKKIVAMRESDIEPIFNSVKEKLMRKLRSIEMKSTVDIAQTYLAVILKSNSFEPEELVQELQNLDYKQFKRDLKERWLKTGHMLVFVSGNLSQDTA